MLMGTMRQQRWYRAQEIGNALYPLIAQMPDVIDAGKVFAPPGWWPVVACVVVRRVVMGAVRRLWYFGRPYSVRTSIGRASQVTGMLLDSCNEGELVEMLRHKEKLDGTVEQAGDSPVCMLCVCELLGAGDVMRDRASGAAPSVLM